MRIKHMFLLVLLLLVACSSVEESVSAKAPTPTNEQADAEDLQAKILKVSTDLPYDSNWWVVSRDTNTMTIHVEAENIESVLFWVAPTGTETWKERELIGYDIDASDGWSLSWEFGDRQFHDHIAVQALGMDRRTQANESIIVHTLEE
ncbi:hypothetical protein [Paenibacillus sp. HGF5]|uniref:hypothetical protein n=1 Tax=Paenibacillus sp. HGF5 TaxID=908341 RepID=UPI0002071C98|nr:hypothetical protein [Paenibacillus sp. HGF5]EGG37906.1 putative lipoprotein [Paenibacillus sp. HGF5]